MAISIDRKQLTLGLQLMLSGAGVTWSTNYYFKLAAISIAKTDILASQVRDIQDEMEKMVVQQKEQKAQINEYWSGKLSSTLTTGAMTLSKHATSNDGLFALENSDKRLKVGEVGTYRVTVTIIFNMLGRGSIMVLKLITT